MTEKERWEEVVEIVMEYCPYGCAVAERSGKENFVVARYIDWLEPGDKIVGIVGELMEPEQDAFDQIPEEYRNMFHEAFEKKFGGKVGT